MKAVWTSAVERAGDEIPDPPGSWADDAVMAFDHGRGALVYINSPRHHAFGKTWVLGEDGWSEETHEAIQVSSDQLWVGHWDASRGGVACWSVYNDYVAEQRVPVGVLVNADGVTPIETVGEVMIEPPATSRSSCAIFGHEQAERARTWMITPTRIQALEDGVWTQVYLFEPGEFASNWRNATSARAVWDARRAQLIISVLDDDRGDELFLYCFDGESFKRLTMEGLPAPGEFYDHWKNAAFAITASPTSGVHIALGDPLGTYRFGEQDVWERVESENEPMRSNRATAAIDERDGALWSGPGEYQLAPDIHAKTQHIFYRFDGHRWCVFGDIETPSPTDIYQGVALAAHEGTLHIITRQYEPLMYSVARDGVWEAVVTKEDAPEVLEALGLESGAVVEAAAVDDNGILHAFFRDGAVAKWGGESWSLVCGPDEGTFKVRQAFSVAWHDALGCFVVWGGEVKNRASNHTFYLGEQGWRKEKKSSPKPAKARADGARLLRDRAYMVHDTREETLVRVRFADVSILKDGVWVEQTPSGYEQVASMIAPYPVQDPETGELLLLDFFGHACWRFGYDHVERVATLVDHPRASNPDNGTYGEVPPFLISGEFAFDRASGALIGQGSKNAAMQFMLSLREVFEHASSLGEPARASQEVAEDDDEDAPSFGDAIRLYDLEKEGFWYGDLDGAEVIQREGRLWSWQKDLANGKAKEKRKVAKDEVKARASLHKLASSRAAKGFVTAQDLPDEALTNAFTRAIDEIQITGPLEDEEDRYVLECLGGRPRGLAKKDWPRDARGELLGHLVSVANFGTKKARVVSVFVPPNEFAMEDGECVAIPRTERHTSKGPSDPPGPVALIEPQQIFSDFDQALEVFPERIAPFEEADVAFAERIEAWHEGLPRDEEIMSKVGGNPRWLQGEEWPFDEAGERYTFFAQLDFSRLPTEAINEAWPEARIWGTLYIFLAPDEATACAFWQYN